MIRNEPEFRKAIVDVLDAHQAILRTFYDLVGTPKETAVCLIETYHRIEGLKAFIANNGAGSAETKWNDVTICQKCGEQMKGAEILMSSPGKQVMRCPKCGNTEHKRLDQGGSVK